MRRTEPTEEASPPTSSGRWSGTFSALSFPNFRLLWFGTLFMSAGTWVQQVTLGWLVFERTDSPLQVSGRAGDARLSDARSADSRGHR